MPPLVSSSWDDAVPKRHTFKSRPGVSHEVTLQLFPVGSPELSELDKAALLLCTFHDHNGLEVAPPSRMKISKDGHAYHYLNYQSGQFIHVTVDVPNNAETVTLEVTPWIMKKLRWAIIEVSGQQDLLEHHTPPSFPEINILSGIPKTVSETEFYERLFLESLFHEEAREKHKFPELSSENFARDCNWKLPKPAKQTALRGTD